MAITINAKGTSVPYFRIGKSGVTMYQGGNDPHQTLGYPVRENDIWFDTNENTLKFRNANSQWDDVHKENLSDLADIDLTGLADGYVLRYDSTAGKWEAVETMGGLASDWGSIANTASSIDGYSGDIWNVHSVTAEATYNYDVKVKGQFDNSENTGAMLFPVGTTAQRPGTPQSGMVRFNSTTSRFEGYNGSEWINIDIPDDWGSVGDTP